MGLHIYVLILTIVGENSQSGMSIAMHEFGSKSACQKAAWAWLDAYPRTPDRKYYSEGSPRAICVPKDD